MFWWSSESEVYKTILVGYDSSEESKRALRKAISLAKEHGSEMIIVTAVNARMLVGLAPRSYGYPVLEHILEEGNAVLSEAVKEAEEEGVKEVRGSVEDGIPEDMVLSKAAQHGADLIVVGHREISGFERFRTVSVSSHVVGNAHCDILVVK